MTGATLVWIAPTQYANGDPLLPDAIAGYYIFVEADEVTAENVATLPRITVGATPTSRSFIQIASDLGGGTVAADLVGRWFAITAFTPGGFESARTEAVRLDALIAGPVAVAHFVTF